MYFATLTEVPILEGLLKSGMGKGPALALLLLLAAVSFAADKSAKAPSEGPDWIPLDDPKLQEVLAKSETAGAYDVPALNLKKDDNYANTSVDVEPFGGTKPWKENFLSQLTYWGAGRATWKCAFWKSRPLGRSW